MSLIATRFEPVVRPASSNGNRPSLIITPFRDLPVIRKQTAWWAFSNVQSVNRLVVAFVSSQILSLVIGFDLYLIYWHYRNWTYLKRHVDPKIRPVLRTLSLGVPILGSIFVYRQFSALQTLAASSGFSGNRRKGWSIAAALLLPGCVRLFPLGALGVLSIVPVVAVQRKLNNYWRGVQPHQPERDTLTPGEFGFLVLGGVAVILVVFFCFLAVLAGALQTTGAPPIDPPAVSRLADVV